MKTLLVAEHMLTTGKAYTAGLLSRELGISVTEASGKLFNIRNSKKYVCLVSPLPGRKVKVVTINGRKISSSKLWRMALCGNPTQR